jgi:phage tail-like protein
MAVRADRPYVQFNFVVHLGDDTDPNSFAGGFQEVSGIGMEVTVTEYRNGNDADNGVRKLTGLNKAADVTLKRGVIGATNLYNWLDEIRDGAERSTREVTIVLMSESHKPVLEWTLHRARIIKCTYGPLNAKGNDAAMEEMVLAYERLVMKAAQG